MLHALVRTEAAIRGGLAILGLVIVAAGIGVAICRAMRIAVGPVEMAAVVAVLAGELALLPVGLYRGMDPAVRFQMAWLGSILHLVLCAGAGAAAFFLLRPATTPFVMALLGMYWVTLAGVCGVMVRVLRRPVAGFSQAQSGGSTGIFPANPG